MAPFGARVRDTAVRAPDLTTPEKREAEVRRLQDAGYSRGQARRAVAKARAASLCALEGITV